MARVTNGTGKIFSGTIGQLVFVSCGGKTYVRMVPASAKLRSGALHCIQMTRRLK